MEKKYQEKKISGKSKNSQRIFLRDLNNTIILYNYIPLANPIFQTSSLIIRMYRKEIYTNAILRIDTSNHSNYKYT